MDTVTPPASARPQAAPVISIIIPAHNVTDYIAETLNSVLSQSFKDFEIIVVNDGCPDTDRLEKVLEAYQPFIVYLKKENAGVSSARNMGIAAARARLIATLDADDIWEPNYLEQQLLVLRKHPGADLVYCNAVFFGATPDAGRTFMELFPSSGEVTFQSVVAKRCVVFTSVVAVREAIIRAGMFDCSISSGEDLDLWLRMLHYGSRFVYHTEPLVRYRSRPSSLSNDPVKLNRNNILVLEKLGRTLELSAEDRECVRASVAVQQAYLDLNSGKRAFFTGDRNTALQKLKSANVYFKSPKITAAVLALQFAPAIAFQFARLRVRQNPAHLR